jgi:DNA-binding transcriptional ArsR family regulator
MVAVKRKRRDAVFKALADPTRREILDLLADGRMTVGQIARNFRTSRPAISKHLRSLRNAGLVVTHKKGAANLCELDGRPLQAVSAWLRRYEAFWDESLRNLKRHVEENP